MNNENDKKKHFKMIKDETYIKFPLLKSVCRDFMQGECNREYCKFIHDNKLCKRFWKNGSCKYKDGCRHKHFVSVRDENDNQKTDKNNNKKKPKNTECFIPMTEPVDLRVVLDLGTDFLSTKLTSRDVLLVPNLFKDFKKGVIYNNLVKEINECGIPSDELLKLWHGNDVIEGTHLICNDRTPWKKNCKTFNMVVERLKKFFNMDVKATRLNWYKDTSQWKAFHKDSAAVNPQKAATQNFTVAVSFGIDRDCAFEVDKPDKTVVSFPIGDGQIYCFTNDTNLIWRHGVLQDMPIRYEGRISIILWGWIDGIKNY